MVLTVAFDYGGRAELMGAVRQVRAEGAPVTPEAIDKHLYLPELPPVDVMVRTSRRAAGLQLPAVAGRRCQDPLHRRGLARLRRRRSRRWRSPSSDDRAPPPRRRRSKRSATVTAALPAAEDRPGNAQMAELVAASIEHGRHLIVQAGTGTGKTLAYLVPAITSGKRTVVVDRDQGAAGPARHEGPPVPRRRARRHWATDVDWAVLKGRSNYVCLQRLREMSRPPTGQLELDEHVGGQQARDQEDRRVGRHDDTGDQAELDWNPSDAAWRSVSVGSDECPGADRCPMGQECFAETGAPPGAGVRRDRRQHPSLRAPRRQRRGDPAGARRRRVRRGPRARRHR